MIRAMKQPTDSMKIVGFRGIINCLPEGNYRALICLLRILRRALDEENVSINGELAHFKDELLFLTVSPLRIIDWYQV